MRRSELARSMHRAGLSLVDAHTAARIAMNSHKRDRDALILRARECGLSLRVIGKLFGLSYEWIRRVSTLSVG
jgi:hypothetical protein